jgi:eukaryotic-like serine/threonine-protein kinase
MGMSDVLRIGRYEVLKHLASGGMGDVYLARFSGVAGFERHAVLKTLHIASDDDDVVAMFLDEARVAGRMHHQHITPAYELARDDDGHYFLVMDYVHGQTAKAVWRRSGEINVRLPLDFALTVVSAAASALHYAHTLRARDGEPLEIVHRDVSPSNLMISYDGAIKLIDFGIAKAARRASLTQAGHVKGTFAYMAPEQIDGGVIDRRTDTFALGAVLYELTTMRRAFREATNAATISRIKQGGVVPPSRIVPGFPRELEAIIMTALASDPAARFQDAHTMRRAIEELARTHRLRIGDAAVIPVMEVLFESRDEPWQAPERPSSSLAVPISAIDGQDTVPVESPEPGSDAPAVIHDLPTTRLSERTSAQPEPALPAVLIPKLRPSRATSCGVAVAIVVGAAALVWLSFGSRDPELVVPSIRPARAAAPIVTPLPEPPPPSERSEIRIRITTTPDDATVLLDGQRLGHTPYDGTLPKAPGRHSLKIRRRGYVPRKLDIELSSDVAQDFVLQPLAPEPVASP